MTDTNTQNYLCCLFQTAGTKVLTSLATQGEMKSHMIHTYKKPVFNPASLITGPACRSHIFSCMM